jgi:hypothetical protein
MSEVKVNKISPRSGTTITLGDSGDTFTVPSGVTFDASSGGLAGTLTTAAQPNITSVGTLTSFTSTGIDDNATGTAITINSSEVVSIGTTVATATLNVLADSGSEGIDVLGRSSDNRSRIQLKSNDGSTNYSQWDYSGTTVELKALVNVPLVFRTNNTEQMRIDSSGNVGIGTSSPLKPLEIQKDNAGNSETLLLLQNNSGTDGTEVEIRLAPTPYPRDIGNAEDGGVARWSSIRATRDGAGNGTRMSFLTNSGGANPSERMRINHNGNIGIGTSSPGTKLEVVGTGVNGIELGQQSDGNDSSRLFFTNSTNVCAIRSSGGSLKFSTGATIGSSSGDDRVIIDSSGNVGIGTTSPTNALTVGGDINSNKLQLASNAGSHTRLLLIQDLGNAGANRNFIEFHNNSGSTAGRIEHNGSTTVSYITSSDYRLKENVSYDFDATTRLKQLKPARFNFIEEPNTTIDGFLAHEVSDIVPEAISGEKDEVQVWKEGEELPEGVSVGDNKIDENGNTIMQIQGIDQAKLVPLLVKTIQELEARITTLENA